MNEYNEAVKDLIIHPKEYDLYSLANDKKYLHVMGIKRGKE